MTESMEAADAGTEIFGAGARAEAANAEVRGRPSAAIPPSRGVLAAVRRWRTSRPFWGCLILALGGYQVMSPMLGATLQMVVGAGIRAASPLLIGGGMVLAAVLALFIPSNRHFLGIAGMVLAVASLPFANLGGWLLGMVLGIVGAGMIFAWAPYTDAQLAEFAGRERRKAERRAAGRAVRVAKP